MPRGHAGGRIQLHRRKDGNFHLEFFPIVVGERFGRNRLAACRNEIELSVSVKFLGIDAVTMFERQFLLFSACATRLRAHISQYPIYDQTLTSSSTGRKSRSEP